MKIWASAYKKLVDEIINEYKKHLDIDFDGLPSMVIADSDRCRNILGII